MRIFMLADHTDAKQPEIPSLISNCWGVLVSLCACWQHCDVTVILFLQNFGAVFSIYIYLFHSDARDQQVSCSRREGIQRWSLARSKIGFGRWKDIRTMRESIEDTRRHS